MDNFGWDNPSPNIWSNEYESNISGSETNYCVISSKSELNESFFTSPSLEMQHDNNAVIDIDQVNEMVELLVSPSFNSVNNNPILNSFNSALYPLPENFNHTSQELQIYNASKGNISVLFNPIGSGNLSSGESEQASQCSSQSNPSKNHVKSKRKYEDMYSNNSSQYLPISSSTHLEKGFQIYFDKSTNSKKPKLEKECSSKNIDFRNENKRGNNSYEPDTEAIAQVKEMIYRAAAMRPVNLVLEEAAVDKPQRKNVKISSDPQTVAARHRRERIGDRLRVLQRLVPGGSKMDTASMLDEAANYLKFLKTQVSALENLGTSSSSSNNCFQMPFNLQSTLFNP